MTANMKARQRIIWRVFLVLKEYSICGSGTLTKLLRGASKRVIVYSTQGFFMEAELKSINPVPSPALRDRPAKLFVETTTRCNLACPMCAKQAGGARSASGNLDPSLFTALKPVFPYVESLVLNGIGEPLLHPGLEAFVKTARSE